METTTVRNGESQLIPVSQVKQGFNYRRRFNAEKMTSLRESIRLQGLLQPITVRKVDDGYQLIAGGRRYRAFVEEFGEQAEIKAEVRVMTDAEATAAMLAENNEREDPSIIEDAEGAARMMGLCNGDREEAIRRLGWSRSKLDRRLAVMNAIQPVRDAYLNDQILVGHVEILAALRKEVQQRVIEAMLKQPGQITIEQLKAMAEQSLQSLDAAIFDRTDCGGCQYNTGQQQAMFETSFGGSRCTNMECYQQKTEAELEVRAKALAEAYQVVRIVRVGDNSTVRPLRADGFKGVGEQQALACRTCADFGACVSAVPDKLGNVYKDVCFNQTCNDEKVAANAKAVKATEVTSQSEAEKPQNTAGPKPQQPVPKSTPVATARSEPRVAIKDYRETIWRAVFQRAAQKLPVLQNRALLVTIALNRPSDMDSLASSQAIEKALGVQLETDRSAAKLLRNVLALEQTALATAMQHLAANLSKNAPINEVTDYLKVLEIRIESYWKLNQTFLDILTKTEIDAVCTELGLAKAAGKQYDKLKNGSKKDFIEGVLAIEGFPYVGSVPALMRWDR